MLDYKVNRKRLSLGDSEVRLKLILPENNGEKGIRMKGVG